MDTLGGLRVQTILPNSNVIRMVTLPLVLQQRAAAVAGSTNRISEQRQSTNQDGGMSEPAGLKNRTRQADCERKRAQ